MKSVCILLFFCVIVAPCLANETVLASGHPDWAPIMYQNGDQIVGIAPDIVEKVFDDLGADVNCMYVGSWADVQELGKIGKIDLIVAAYATEERKKSFFYSEPYLVDNISIFTTYENLKYDSPISLLGYNIAVLRGDSYGQEIDDFLEDYSQKLEINVYGTPEEGFESLLSGKNDIFLYATDAGERIVAKNGYQYIRNKVIAKELFYILISKKSKYAELLPQINNMLQMYKNTGIIPNADL